MSENMEAEVPAAEAAAPVQEAQPAQLDADTGNDATPAEDADDDAHEAKPKGGFQRRIGELTHRVRDTERDRDYWRDLAMRQTQQPQPQQYAQPEYVAADGEYEPAPVDPREIISTVRQQLETEQRLSSFNSRVAETFPDGEPEGIAALKRAPAEYVTPAIFDLITSSEHAPKLADHLGMNQAELARLAALPPHRQGLEFARLEARIAEPKVTSTKAPTPPPAVGTRAAPVEKDPDRMSTSEWLAWRNAQLRKG